MLRRTIISLSLWFLAGSLPYCWNLSALRAFNLAALRSARLL